MSSEYLNRDDSGFSQQLWSTLDNIVVSAAKSNLTVRKILQIEGPFGFQLKSLDSEDYETKSASVEGARLTASCPAPVVVIQSSFSLEARDIAAYEQNHLPLAAQQIAKAAITCARQEDNLLLYGSEELKVKGLLTFEGTTSSDLGDWEQSGSAADAIINASTKLDNAGFAGPYVLALSPSLYNKLFRLYPNSNTTELDHVKQIVTGGIVKAPAIDKGGILIAEGPQFASIVLGQDLMAGFTGPQASSYEFFVRESVALRLTNPAAVCVLK